MDVVLVQLQQEHDQHEQRVYHEEREHGRVAQLFEIFSYTGLKVMLSNRVLQLDSIFFRSEEPEKNFSYFGIN